MIPVTELRSGAAFKDPQGLWEVVSYKHTKMGRGSATIKVKARNLSTGTLVEKTFTSGQRVEDIDITKKKGQFLYVDKETIAFMDPVTFEQFSLPKTVAVGKVNFLKEGETYDLAVAEDQVLSVTIPKLIVLKVTETGPGVKGDSVSAVTKDAVLENGLRVKVPLFINIGDKLKIDTRNGEYVERVK